VCHTKDSFPQLNYTNLPPPQLNTTIFPNHYINLSPFHIHNIKCLSTLSTLPVLNYNLHFTASFYELFSQPNNSSTAGLCAVSSLEPQAQDPIKDSMDLAV